MIDTSHYILSFLEGFALAFSPCILPILPLILSGSAADGKSRPYGIILGFIIFFTVFSLISRSLLSSFGIPQDVLQKTSFALLALFGLIMLVPMLDTGFSKFTSGIAGKAQNLSSHSKIPSGFLGGIILGGLIGIVWTPCAGPLMAAAILQIIQSKTNLDTSITIAAFASGAAFPMLIIALIGHKITHHVRALSRHTGTLKRVMGVILIFFSLLGFSGINLGEVYVNAKDKNTIPVEKISMQKDIIDALPTPYSAPQISGITQWINSEPKTIEQLKGKVVLIDFWTYSCINCIRTLPYLKSWYDKYHDQGFEIIGIHSPEFSFEKEANNVRKAAQKYGLNYPIALDNDFITWNNYSNRYWPAHYLINKDGNVVYTHFGEGNYDITEKNIQYLLGIDKGNIQKDTNTHITQDQSPETYLGLDRAEREVKNDQSIPLHHWAIGDGWSRHPQYIQSQKEGASLIFHASAEKIFLVLDKSGPKSIDINIQVKTENSDEFKNIKNINIDQASLYELIDLKTSQEFYIKIKSFKAGLKVFAFTFG